MRILLVALAAALLGAPSAAYAQWVKVHTKHFLVYSDSAKAAKEAAQRLEDFHLALEGIYPASLPSRNTAVLPVVAFKNSSSFRNYLPLDSRGKRRAVGGVYFSVPGMAMVAQDGSNLALGWSSHIGYHYVHRVMDNPRAPMPVWFSEGLADFYASASLTADRAHVRLGVPLPYYLARLEERQWMPFQQVFATRLDPEIYRKSHLWLDMRALSWLVVHYCLAEGRGDKAQRLGVLAEALDGGASTADAIRQAFGMEPEAFRVVLRAYARGETVPYRTVPLVDRAPRLRPQVQPVSEAEIESRLGQIAVLEGRPEGIGQLERAATLDPQSPLPYVGLGWAAMVAEDVVGAREAFGRAVELDSDQAAAYTGFAWAWMSADDGGASQAAEVVAALERALAINPDLVPAYRSLVQISLATGNAAAAVRWVKLGLAADPFDPVLRKVLSDHAPTGATPTSDD